MGGARMVEGSEKVVIGKAVRGKSGPGLPRRLPKPQPLRGGSQVLEVCNSR